MLLAPDAPEDQHLRMLWHRLLTTYVSPGAPREINLLSEVRDTPLRHVNIVTPPPPEILDSAVKCIHELMEESIFLPFLSNQAAGSETP